MAVENDEEHFVEDVPEELVASTGSRRVAFIDQSDASSESFFGKHQDLSITFEKAPRFWNDYKVVALAYDSFIGSPQYGFNQIRTTAYGHKFELDDTPGLERINIAHGNGSRIELTSDGNILLRAKNSLYEIYVF